MAVGLKWGEACTACKHGQCTDPPTPDEPLCLTIGGRTIEITECPQRYAGENARQAVRYAEFARKGVLPVSGGLLDQSQSFITACELIWSLEAPHRAKRNPFGES